MILGGFMRKDKLFKNVIGYSLAFFFLGMLSSIFFRYILGQQPPTIFFYISITSLGIFLISLLINAFWGIKSIDVDYFRNVMIGVAGGLAVWVFSGADFTFKNGFWLSINQFLIRMGFAIMILLIGYSICKKKKLKRNKS